jgi:hypothetical protein
LSAVINFCDVLLKQLVYVQCQEFEKKIKIVYAKTFRQIQKNNAWKDYLLTISRILWLNFQANQNFFGFRRSEVFKYRPFSEKTVKQDTYCTVGCGYKKDSYVCRLELIVLYSKSIKKVFIFSKVLTFFGWIHLYHQIFLHLTLLGNVLCIQWTYIQYYTNNIYYYFFLGKHFKG